MTLSLNHVGHFFLFSLSEMSHESSLHSRGGITPGCDYWEAEIPALTQLLSIILFSYFVTQEIPEKVCLNYLLQEL